MTHPNTHPDTTTVSDAALYQRLRSHLAFLKLPARRGRGPDRAVERDAVRG